MSSNHSCRNSSTIILIHCKNWQWRNSRSKLFEVVCCCPVEAFGQHLLLRSWTKHGVEVLLQPPTFCIMDRGWWAIVKFAGLKCVSSGNFCLLFNKCVCVLAWCQGQPGSSQEIWLQTFLPKCPLDLIAVLAVLRLWSAPFTKCEAWTWCLCSVAAYFYALTSFSGNQRNSPQRMLPPPGLTEQNSRMSEVCVEDRHVIWFGLDIVQLPVVWQFLALVQEKEFPAKNLLSWRNHFGVQCDATRSGLSMFQAQSDFCVPVLLVISHPGREMKRCSPLLHKGVYQSSPAVEIYVGDAPAGNPTVLHLGENPSGLWST